MILLALIGCGPRVDCTEAGAELIRTEAGALSCAEGEDVVDYVELLAGRPVSRNDATKVLREVASRFKEDPGATRSWLSEITLAGSALSRLEGLAAAEARSTRVFAASQGKDLIVPADGELWNVQSHAMSVWSKDEAEQLAMTESDVEGWIRYASLCREAQGGTVLRISVADRVTVYNELMERFDSSDRAAQIALGAIGPFWLQIRDRWKEASYEEQMAWVGAAPLPPPMTATSLGYTEAVFSSNLPLHAATLHQLLGPFPLGGPVDRFGPEPAAVPTVDPSVPGSQPGTP